MSPTVEEGVRSSWAAGWLEQNTDRLVSLILFLGTEIFLSNGATQLVSDSTLNLKALVARWPPRRPTSESHMNSFFQSSTKKQNET